LSAFAVVAAAEPGVAGHQRIQFADAAQARRLQLLQFTRASSPQQVVQRSVHLVFRGGNDAHLPGALDDAASGEVADKGAGIADGLLQRGGFEDAVVEARAQAVFSSSRQACCCQRGFQQAGAQLLLRVLVRACVSFVRS